MNTEKPVIKTIAEKARGSVTVKIVTIILLMLLLLIPSFMIRMIIQDREDLSQQTISEVSAKWADAQQINGPILTIPLTEVVKEDDKYQTITHYWHVLPKTLDIKGQINPDKLKRGIYEVVVYRSNINLKGTFNLKELPNGYEDCEFQFDEAFMTIGISDLGGLKNQFELKWEGQKLPVLAHSRIQSIIHSGVTVELPVLELGIAKDIPFSFDLDLSGSKNLSVVPLGDLTDVNLKSSWEAPSFNGNFLPDSREVEDGVGFAANWKVLQLNRNFPPSWVGSGYGEKIQDAAFGVDLILPLDDYQKSMRSAKYAVMTIALTFLIFFLVEILNKRRFHPFQYGLVGLSLCLFYILLVSISEHSNFGFAYGVSTLATIGMITMYAIPIFKSKQLVSLLVLILSGLYGFLFVILQLNDYALLMGSLGLMLILGITMYLTRKIDWYNL